MPAGRTAPSRCRIVKSRSHGRLISAATSAALSFEPETIVIVPSVAAGERFAHALPNGIFGLHRLSLVSWAYLLSRPYLAERGLTPVGGLGLEAVAARALHHAALAKELKYFYPVQTLPGFAKALARTIQELQLADVQPAQLTRTGAAGSDLTKLLKRYRAELEETRLIDLAGMLQLARDSVTAEGGSFIGLPVIALDISLESAAHQSFFRAIAEKSPAIFAATSAREDILENILGVAAENLDGEEHGSLARLRRGLFLQGSLLKEETAEPDGAFEIFSAPGESLEAVEIARRMMQLAREGVPFDHMAILLRSVDRYQPLIEEALRRAEIPAYFSRGTLRPDPAGRAFLALLECAAEKYSASRFAEYLSLSQVPSRDAAPDHDEWIAPQDELLGFATPAEPPAVIQPPEYGDADEASAWTPARWEALLIDAAIIEGKDRWKRRLAGKERELELRASAAAREDENQRAGIERQLTQLRQLREYALPVIDQLAALPRSASWGVWITDLASLARKTLRRPEAVLSVLAELEPMADVGPLTLEEVAGVLSERLRFLRTEPPGRSYGKIFVGSIDEARGREFAVVFLPGLSEGLFPQRALEDPLLLDQFRRALTELLPTRDDRVEQERQKLQLAVGAARDRLVASYPRLDTAEGRPRVPSFYALELPRAIEGHLPKLRQFEEDARRRSAASMNWPAPRDPNDAIDDAEFDLAMLAREHKAAKYLVDVSPTLARSLRARWKRWNQKWWDADGLVATGDDTLSVLAGHRLAARAWSPSSLQKFAECPYEFALHGIFGLKPREDAEPLEQLDPLTRGELFHVVQRDLLTALKRSGHLPVTPQTLDEALRLLNTALDRAAADYKEQLAPAIERVWQTSIEDLRTDLRGWLQAVAANDAAWEPLYFEFAFGLPASSGRDAASTSAEAILDEGVHLRGSIDLVECEVASGSLRVTDHKTGKRPDAVPLYVGGGKLLQPLLYGLAAQKLLGRNVTAGRLFYATQRGAYEPMEIKINERSRAVLARLIANIDASVANGFLPPAPQKETCEHCDYRAVCGPYEEQRYEEIKNRRDERLDALVEIRGMA